MIQVNSPYGVKDIAVEYELMPHFFHLCNCTGHSTSKCRKNADHVHKHPAFPPKQVWRPILIDVLLNVQILKLTTCRWGVFRRMQWKFMKTLILRALQS